MEQELIERNVLASIDSLEALAKARGFGVTEEGFVLYPHVFRFIEDYAREFTTGVPSKELLSNEFKLELIKPADSDYYASLLVEKELGRKLHAVIEKGISLLVEKEQPLAAVSFLLGELSRLRRSRTLTQSFTDADALKRLDRYIEKSDKVKRGVPLGLSTGIGPLDTEQLGLVSGNMVGIVGNTAIGKSWLLEYMSAVAYVDNKARVLFLSPEMSVSEVEDRWDPIVSRLYGMELSNLGLARGVGVNLEQYREFLTRVSQRKDWLTCSTSSEGTLSLHAIEDLVVQFKPTLLAIDGLPLLGSGGFSKGALWERLADVAYGLKGMSVRQGLVTLITNQATRGAEAKEAPGPGDSGYSYAFVQACDRVLMVSEAANKPKTRLIRLVKVRVGERTFKPVEISWDVDKGGIGG